MILRYNAHLKSSLLVGNVPHCQERGQFASAHNSEGDTHAVLPHHRRRLPTSHLGTTMDRD